MRFNLKTLIGGALMIALAALAVQKLTTDPRICRGEPVISAHHRWNPNTPAGMGPSVPYYTCQSCGLRVADSVGSSPSTRWGGSHD
jgi:hypothetical protein